ncbi:6-phosphogluconolactonase [Corynebacterium choanae]|uniref:6-phosphogluconolactonase n=1 Tax=Corynebacterium choanae TaxID=1862358 RepID=A0A3G6J6Y3_9CORY|nr:6-phosphogluconolactonase [Corynebacterium choanae]AZA13629.1 6-phosphogluconolactonase [Corynebacterium choanae]
MVTVLEFPTRDELTQQAARDLVSAIVTAQHSGGIGGDHIARIVLTGGTAGIATLAAVRELLDGSDSDTIDRERVFCYFGDERFVPHDDPESNYAQAKAALLDHCGLNPAHIYPVPTSGITPAASAAQYAATLARTAPHGFDVHLLGMGGEGHINSLFPHTQATATTDVLVTAELNSPKPPAQRVTLTFPAIASANEVWLLVSGNDKAEAVGRLLAGEDAAALPVAGARGRVATKLYVDAAAATAIKHA